MIAIKLDENLGTELLQRARDAGIDAESVRSQKLTGAPDSALFVHCRSEGRTMITLDLDFSDPFRFPPAGGPGTIILRPHRPSHIEIAVLFADALRRLECDPVRGQIWIVEAGRVRIYRDWDAENDDF